MLPTTAANSGAITPSGQPVAIEKAQQASTESATDAADQEREPVVPVRDGESQRVRSEGELKLIRIATIGDRLAQKLAILHDIDKVAQPDNEAGDRDIGPAGIRIQRRLDFIERRAQRIGFQSVAAARFQPPRCPCADFGNMRRRFLVGVERELAVLNRAEQRKQRQHMLPEAPQALRDIRGTAAS